MKKINKGLRLFVLIFIAFLTLFSLSEIFAVEEISSLPQENESSIYVDGEVLVKYREDKIDLSTAGGRTRSGGVSRVLSLEEKEFIPQANIVVVEIRDGKTVQEKIEELEKDPNVEYAEPNYKRELFSIPTNDTFRNRLWGLHNYGQTVNGLTGTPGADISILGAWEIDEGTNSEIIVAIIDEGVAYNHPDLLANMWDGSNCRDENGNYLGGCKHGYDFFQNDKDPLPINSHGTHIAGTIAAVKNNNIGIVGVAPNSKIMAIRAGDYYIYTSAIIKGIDFAIENGARIINASYGSEGYSKFEQDAIIRFRNSGGLFIAASGNSGSNNDSQPIYPASYNLENIIAVAATNQHDNLASFSNYGINSVDIGAPGVNIYSTAFDSSFSEKYEYKSGTSMATPHVVGLAALIWGYNPELDYSEVKDIIFTTGDEKTTLVGKTSTGRRINAHEAMQMVRSDLNRIRTINSVPNVTVDYRRPESESKGLLSPTTTIVDNNDNSYIVDLDWEIQDYNPFVTGNYTAIGVFELPGLVIQSNPETPLEVWATVRVSQAVVKEALVTGPRTWDVSRTTGIVSGDFNGDGTDSVAFMYDYGRSSMGIWFADFDQEGQVTSIELAHRRPSGTWDASKSTMVSGDFTGNGIDDIAVMYDYGRSSMGIWLFESDGEGGLNHPRRVHLRPAGTWDASKSTMVSGDFNGNGTSDIAIMYDYGRSSMGIWFFESDGEGGLNHPRRVHLRPAGTWDASKSTMLSGDFNGNGTADIAIMYDYGRSSMGIWFFESDGEGGLNHPRRVHHRPAGTWDASKSTIVSGDFNANGTDDIVIMYDYANSRMALWLFGSDGVGGLNHPRVFANHLDGTWDVSKTGGMVIGDFTGTNTNHVVANYDHGNSSLGIWLW